MSENPNVDQRTPSVPIDLAEVGRGLLEEAAANANGRSALTLTPAEGGTLKQTLLAIKAGQALSDHPAPGPATLQVLQGSATITGDTEGRVEAGEWCPIPTSLHGVHADEDVIALLTVVIFG